MRKTLESFVCRMAVLVSLIVALAAVAPRASFAGAYFRGFDPNNIHQSAGFLLDTHANGDPVAGVTDIALITHSTADGSIIPVTLQKWLPPENWSPLSVGAGANFKVDGVIDLGSSINVAPQIGALFLAAVDSSSAPWLQAVKGSLLGNLPLQTRIGYAEVLRVARAGTILPPDQMLPGRGLGDILNRAGRVNLGVAWVW